jgi:hypothetical protein
MGELGALFNPGMRHEIEERQSKASRREEEGQADPGNLRIDLLSGVAVIKMGGKQTAPEPEGDDMSSPDATEADATDPADERADADQTHENESVQNTDEDSAEMTESPTADTGSAPRLPAGTSVSTGSDVDDDALEIARGSSNTEPPV